MQPAGHHREPHRLPAALRCGRTSAIRIARRMMPVPHGADVLIKLELVSRNVDARPIFDV
jgi:hypothetical protein